MAITPFEPTELHPTETWTHLFRVGFWWQQSRPPENAHKELSWGVEVWDLEAEDVHEVIAWADAQAGPDRIYTLYIRLEDGEAPGEDLLVRIAGADPTKVEPGIDGFLRTHP